MDENKIENTTMYDIETVEESLVSSTLKEVCQALKEKGYNPINQLVGYFISGDPTYITSYKGARGVIKRIDRDELLEVIISEYCSKL